MKIVLGTDQKLFCPYMPIAHCPFIKFFLQLCEGIGEREGKYRRLLSNSCGVIELVFLPLRDLSCWWKHTQVVL